MKGILFVLAGFVIANSVFSQWQNGTDIYNTNAGNVGIGTTTPTFKLDVVGTIRNNISNSNAFTTKSNLGVTVQQGNIGNDFTNADKYLAIFGQNLQYDGTNWVRRNQYGNAWAAVMSHYYYDVRFAASNGSQPENSNVTPSTYLRITDAGNVGIGTTDPGSFKLAVEGKIGARELKVTLTNPWPDYVFHKEYTLLSLAKLENFIRQNNHLPNMPSAKDVKEKEGFEIGDMTTRLLEKVEELTLYVIELKKEIAELKTKK